MPRTALETFAVKLRASYKSRISCRFPWTAEQLARLDNLCREYGTITYDFLEPLTRAGCNPPYVDNLLSNLENYHVRALAVDCRDSPSGLLTIYIVNITHSGLREKSLALPEIPEVAGEPSGFGRSVTWRRRLRR